MSSIYNREMHFNGFLFVPLIHYSYKVADNNFIVSTQVYFKPYIFCKHSVVVIIV
jgi:hypothetical protein